MAASDQIRVFVFLGAASVIVAAILCAVAFSQEVDISGEEDEDRKQRDFFMARAGFSCSMRLEPVPELVLLSLPFVLGGMYMLKEIASIIRHIMAGAKWLAGLNFMPSLSVSIKIPISRG
jgi:hypothetical protein